MPRNSNESAASQARTTATKATPKRHKKATPMVAEAVENSVVVESADREEIARLAYSYWESRGRRDGAPQEDWFRAERELNNRRQLSAKAQASA